MKKNFSKIEKVLTAFSILEKMFPKMDGLMCALRAHINRTLLVIGLGQKKAPKIPRKCSFCHFIWWECELSSGGLRKVVKVIKENKLIQNTPSSIYH